ncbi:beta-N-acetylhexosaminidase [Methyloglobulus sp.]|uniref:beta-N-acetylhexosaminidase n=1 Tax=Methyloglobulus sp. TaxID=2518622 RepID=UPI0032B7B670
MTTEYPIGPVMLDVAGLTLTAQEKEVINHPNTGAVIFFARNYHDPEQITQLINDIRKARNGQILIAVDQEGGRVQRFQNGFTRLPPACCYADTPERAETAGWLMAAELLAVGVDFSFAPVLDVDCGISQVIGNRSFSTEYMTATALASAFRKGMNAAGMAATGKHFPGHGAVAVDSHLALPVDERDLDSIWAKDLVPFKTLIDEGLEAIMPAHVVYKNVDPNPAGFSRYWIQDILRKELGFKGVVFSDDLSMEGAAFAGDYPERARLAQDAGCDMLLVCNNPAAAEKVLNDLPITSNPQREERLSKMQGKTMMNREQLQNSPKWQQSSRLIQELTANYA